MSYQFIVAWMINRLDTRNSLAKAWVMAVNVLDQFSFGVRWPSDEDCLSV